MMICAENLRAMVLSFSKQMLLKLSIVLLCGRSTSPLDWLLTGVSLCCSCVDSQLSSATKEAIITTPAVTKNILLVVFMIFILLLILVIPRFYTLEGHAQTVDGT